MSEETKDEYIRIVSPLFVSGFKAMQTEEILIVDFLTAFPGESQRIVASVALTKDIAENLSRALSTFIQEDEDGEN